MVKIKEVVADSMDEITPQAPGSPLIVYVVISHEQHEFEKLLDKDYKDMYEETLNE